MDISEFAVGADAVDALSSYQIDNFFRRHKSITQDDCDRAASEITGSRIFPTLVQGETSYTVASDANEQRKVVQFRHSVLCPDLIKQARQAYGKFVPNCEAHSVIGGVHVYLMDFVPGVAFSRARRQLLTLGMEQRLLRTVRDFAEFFASAWVNRPTLEQPPGLARDLFAHYSSVISRLSQALPERFQAKLDELCQGLPLLFRPDYPMVLNHDDLLEMNIHVDEATGSITGIVDWADAKLSPFGMSLGGVETILGVETSSSWLFHPKHEYFWMQFWKAFYGFTGYLSDDDKRAIEVGRTLGLFRAYGFDRRPEKDNAAPLQEGDQGFVCLEAFCLRQASPGPFSVF